MDYTYDEATDRLATHNGDVFLKDDLGNWRKLYGDVLPADATEVVTGGQVGIASWERIRRDASLSEPLSVAELR